MNWERAKTLALICFLLINIVLYSLLDTERNRYMLSTEQEKAIRAVFNQHKINMYSHIIRPYPPMRQLSVTGYVYDTEALLRILFPDPEAVISSEEPGRAVFADADAELIISNGYISYDNPAGYGNTPPFDRRPSKEEAIERCQGFITAHFPDFVFESVISIEDGLRICYRQTYQEYIVYRNFIEFFVTEQGICQIDMQFGEIIGWNGAAHDICSPDEVLLTFVQRIRAIRADAPVLINTMDIVYDQEEYSTQDNVLLQATPYYRIFIMDQDEPFMINAYTNRIR